jgi:hypothetical protein
MKCFAASKHTISKSKDQSKQGKGNNYQHPWVLVLSRTMCMLCSHNVALIIPFLLFLHLERGSFTVKVVIHVWGKLTPITT